MQQQGADISAAPGGATGVGATILARYRVVEARGTGGFGTVLTCWDTVLQRRVAIKCIPVATAGTSSTTTVAALAEARTASLLAHPGIVTVYDFESDANCAYLVMEYVDGITLAELLQRVEGGTLTPDETCYVVRSVAAALAYAHLNGVLHLDIKPTNIMINAAGIVKLCDFGIATLASAAGYGGARGGTVGYMPPEQIEGDLVDERSDVFSLAVVAWQSLTGASPFAAATAEASLKLIRRASGARISKAAPNLPAAVDPIMTDALASVPAARTSSVSEFADSLDATLGDAAAGARSIASLVAQATSDEADEADLSSDLPVAFRYPWLSGAITRTASMLVSAGALAAPLQALGAAGPAQLAPALAGAAASAALWPPLGSALAVGALLVAIASPPEGAAAVMLPGIVGVAFALWWVSVALRSQHATCAALAPIALGAPASSPAIAGAFLPPAQAAITAALGWLLARLHASAVACGFDAGATARDLAATMAVVPSWASVAGAAIAAAAIAALTRGATTARGAISAQVVGAILGIALQLAAATMKNGGIVPAPTWPTVGVAVILCVIMGIVIAVRGSTTFEGEAHELHQDL